MGESEKTLTSEGKKVRILNVFFASVFIGYYFTVMLSSSLSWKAEAESKMKHLLFKGKLLNISYTTETLINLWEQKKSLQVC